MNRNDGVAPTRYACASLDHNFGQPLLVSGSSVLAATGPDHAEDGAPKTADGLTIKALRRIQWMSVVCSSFSGHKYSGLVTEAIDRGVRFRPFRGHNDQGGRLSVNV